MPVVGDWSPPPAYSQSYYDKSREKSSPGYYSVYLDTFRTQVELTATRWASVMRFTFPQIDRSNVFVNLPRHGGTVERSEVHTSELQSLMRSSNASFSSIQHTPLDNIHTTIP